jgi:hypothetical protein
MMGRLTVPQIIATFVLAAILFGPAWKARLKMTRRSAVFAACFAIGVLVLAITGAR